MEVGLFIRRGKENRTYALKSYFTNGSSEPARRPPPGSISTFLSLEQSTKLNVCFIFLFSLCDYGLLRKK